MADALAVQGAVAHTAVRKSLIPLDQSSRFPQVLQPRVYGGVRSASQWGRLVGNLAGLVILVWQDVG